MTTQPQTRLPMFLSQREFAAHLGLSARTISRYAKRHPLWKPDATPGRTLRYHTGKLPLVVAVLLGTMTETEALARWESIRARIGYEGVKPKPIGSKT